MRRVAVVGLLCVGLLGYLQVPASGACDTGERITSANQESISRYVKPFRMEAGGAHLDPYPEGSCRQVVRGRLIKDLPVGAEGWLVPWQILRTPDGKVWVAGEMGPLGGTRGVFAIRTTCGVRIPSIGGFRQFTEVSNVPYDAIAVVEY